MTEEMDARFNLVDETAPIDVPFSAHYRRGFAHFTIRDRLPVILTQVIDHLSRDKNSIIKTYGVETQDEIKEIVGKISKLKYELQTDKPLLELEDDEADVGLWNNLIKSLPSDKNSYFSTTWLIAECYLYRRLKSIFLQENLLKNFDYFCKQKINALNNNLNILIILIEYINQYNDDENNVDNNSKRIKLNNFLQKLLKINLWGNRCDLSISAGQDNNQKDNPFSVLNELDKFILVDHTSLIVDCLVKPNEPIVIDIINDNAGYELLTDLLLADYLLQHNYAKCINFHVKTIPWFISDVLAYDFHYTIKHLCNNINPILSNFGKRLKNYLDTEQFILHDTNDYWTSCYDYNDMKVYDNKLYNCLAKSYLLIFKGDLNYRKLLGDIHWLPTKPFEESLRGFRPTNLCTLRTIKADVVSGLPEGSAEELQEKNPKWRETGEYGLIQFAPALE